MLSPPGDEETLDYILVIWYYLYVANHSKGLTEKHLKALALIEEGELTMKQIAVAVGWSYAYFMHTYEGNIGRAGQAAALFQAELRKKSSRDTEKVRELLKENKKLALLKINEVLKSKKNKKLTKPEIKELISLQNSLTKASPSVEVNSFSVYNGLTLKDLENEFKRLSAIAQDASLGRGVRSLATGGQRTLLDSASEGD